MTVSFHKYGEYFPGTGEVRVRPPSFISGFGCDDVTYSLYLLGYWNRSWAGTFCQLPSSRWDHKRKLQVCLRTGQSPTSH